MSKIICDVCGTAYPETASACPICGTARPENVQPAAQETPAGESAAAPAYTYVKGGRFSKSNVRKRNKAAGTSADREMEVPLERGRRGGGGGGRGLAVTAIVLLLALAAVLVYIYIRFFAPSQTTPRPDPSQTGGNTSSQTDNTTQGTQHTEPSVFPCTDLTLPETVVELSEEGQMHLLNVVVQPENTTDTVTFASSDPAVAEVNSEGRITAVAPGQAIITVTCGTVSKDCRVVCIFDTEPPTTEQTLPEMELVLNRSDFTLSYWGEEWDLCSGTDLDASLITWTSSNTDVATVEGGVVTAVGYGIAYITAEYNGETAECVVRCNF